jgi:hypothetical protein
MQVTKMTEYNMVRKRLRILMALMVIWDLVIGVYAVFWGKHMQSLLGLDSGIEPMFLRGVGVYWLFASYMQFLGCRNPEKFLVAIQLSIIFRLSAALFDSIEVLFLLPKPFTWVHYLLGAFVVCNIIIACITIHFLKRMNLKWIEVH